MWNQEIFGNPGSAHQAELVIIVFQDPTWFPKWKQYTLRRKACEILQPLINKLLACGLLVPINLSSNTPVHPVKKKNGTWWSVKSLQIINEAVVPLHLTVPNPYVILAETPPSARWFTVLDLKDAFFCIPLVKESQYLFTFKWEAPGEKHHQRCKQYYLRGSGIALTCLALGQDMLDLDLGPNGKTLQYVDDLLICSPDQENDQKHAIEALIVFWQRGYKVSHSKAKGQTSLTWEFRLCMGRGGCPLT